MKHDSAVAIFLVIALVFLTSLPDIMGPNPAFLQAFVIVVVILLVGYAGVLLYYKMWVEVVQKTNRKVGYGPMVLHSAYWPHYRSLSWPSKFYKKEGDKVNVRKFNSEHKPMVNSWYKEFNKMKRSDWRYYASLLLMAAPILIALILSIKNYFDLLSMIRSNTLT